MNEASKKMTIWNRRDFIRSSVLTGIATSMIPGSSLLPLLQLNDSKDRFKISLAQWSVHKALQKKELDHLDFARKAAESFGIHAVEYVNAFFKDKAEDTAYLNQMNQRAKDFDVKQLLIMIDDEGGLAEPDEKLRSQAVSNHHKWVHAAKHLGCHSIRVNLHGHTTDKIVLHQAAVDGLGALATYASSHQLNVIVENHGGYSSDGAWLAGVIREINLPNCGTLPDFGNFCIRNEKNSAGQEICTESYDRYRGVKELLPYAFAVSAKSYDFDSSGNETSIDFSRMIKLIKKSNYEGYLGIEYEGSRLSEDDGIQATKALLERYI